MKNEKTTNKIKIVLSAIVRAGEKFLLVRDAGKKHWSFPQGKLDRGENLLEAVKREVREETGLEFVPKQVVLPIIVRQHSEMGVRSLKFFFEGEYRGKAQASAEIEEVKFFDINEIKKLKLKTPEILNFLKPAKELQTLPLSALQTFYTDKK